MLKQCKIIAVMKYFPKSFKVAFPKPTSLTVTALVKSSRVELPTKKNNQNTKNNVLKRWARDGDQLVIEPQISQLRQHWQMVLG